jgi:hypothetical protein
MMLTAVLPPCVSRDKREFPSSGSIIEEFGALQLSFLGWCGAADGDGDVGAAGRNLHRRLDNASCNLAMGATLLVGGSGAYSIDNVLILRDLLPSSC